MTGYWDERDLGNLGWRNREEQNCRRKKLFASFRSGGGGELPGPPCTGETEGRSPARWQVPVRLSRWRSHVRRAAGRPAGPHEDHCVPSSSRCRVGRWREAFSCLPVVGKHGEIDGLSERERLHSSGVVFAAR
jgi:hypothetical protein